VVDGVGDQVEVNERGNVNVAVKRVKVRVNVNVEVKVNGRPSLSSTALEPRASRAPPAPASR
jgi:hypothetical protein